jgi:hypothetical protein
MAGTQRFLIVASLGVFAFVASTAEAGFRRGDANDDGRVTMADAIHILDLLFRDTAASVDCLAASDVNDDEAVDISDAVYALLYLFAGGGPIPPPAPGCGDDPTPGALNCSRACPDPAAGVARFEVVVPERIASGAAFRLEVIAVDADGVGPVPEFAGTVELEVSDGRVSPATLDLAAGLGIAQARLSVGASFAVLRARFGSREGAATTEVLPLEAIPGASDAMVPGAVPPLGYVPRAEDYSTGHLDVPRLAVSHGSAVVVPALDATVVAFNELLASIGATIAGGIRGVDGVVGGVLVLRLPSTSHAEAAPLLAALAASPLVALLAPDTELEPLTAPGPESSPPDVFGFDWIWSVLPIGDNYGWELVRVPQLWSFNARLAADGAYAFVGIYDLALFPHDDMASWIGDVGVPDPNDPQTAHGLQVASVIAARFDNGRGTDGVNPFASLVTRRAASKSTETWAQFLVTQIENDRVQFPEMRVINFSYGYNWYSPVPRDPTTPKVAAFISAQGAVFASGLAALAAVAPVPMISAGAGNDSGRPSLNFIDVPGSMGSVVANAALEHGAPGIIVVDAVDYPNDAAVRWEHSNVGGHISAPGVRIPVAASTPFGYKLANGTSLAAPFVTAVASYLALLQPDLTNDEIIDLLRSNVQGVEGGASPVLDAWAAAMDIDRIREGQPILRRLLDIDDGTLDGNRRVDPLTLSDVPDDAARGHGGLGDGEVDMKDFRAFRDALLQAEADAMLALDGGIAHPKLDLNGDGVVDPDPIQENVFPRADFNGDGIVDRTTAERVPGSLDEELTDLEVLAAVFDDPDVDAAELSALLDSGDLEVDGSRLFDVAGATAVALEVRDEASGALVATRSLDPEARRAVITLPAGREHRVSATAATPGGEVIAERVLWIDLGGDVYWRPSCVGAVGVLRAAGGTYNNASGTPGTAVIVKVVLPGGAAPAVDIPLTLRGPAGWNGGGAMALTFPRNLRRAFFVLDTAVAAGAYEVAATIEGAAESACFDVANTTALLEPATQLTYDGAVTGDLTVAWNGPPGAVSYFVQAFDFTNNRVLRAGITAAETIQLAALGGDPTHNNRLRVYSVNADLGLANPPLPAEFRASLRAVAVAPGIEVTGATSLYTGDGSSYLVSFRGGPPRPVAWTVDRGTIDTFGSYTAPLTPGFANITATTTEAPVLSDTLQVSIVERSDCGEILGTWRICGASCNTLCLACQEFRFVHRNIDEFKDNPPDLMVVTESSIELIYEDGAPAVPIDVSGIFSEDGRSFYGDNIGVCARGFGSYCSPFFGWQIPIARIRIPGVTDARGGPDPCTYHVVLWAYKD